MTGDLTPFFAPQGVALIGASANPAKLSHAVLHNLTHSGYKGPVYPVNPRHRKMAGLTCYAGIADVPDPVELAVIILPAGLTPAALEACGQRGLKAAIIISGGFKEVGPAGAALEDECVAIARRYGMRLMGPNGIGTVDLYTGLNTTFLRGLPQPGRIAFVSQSGAVCGGVVDYVSGKQIGFSHFVSLGNEADLTETDLLAYLGQHPQVRVIAAYVEAISNGRRFMQVARLVAASRPVVLLKAGRTQAGDRAVSSHTGSLAGSHSAYTAAFRQSGVIEAESVAELFDISLALACQPLPAGNRVLIVTNAGGPAVLAADSLSNHGLTLPTLSGATQTTLRNRLNPSAQVANPVDMLGGAGPDEYQFALQTGLADPAVDAALVIHVPQALVNPAEVARAVSRAAAAASKPILTCLMGDSSIHEARQILHRHNLPMYVFPEAAGRVLQAMLAYRQWCAHHRPEPPAQPAIDVEAARQILAAAGSRPGLGEADVRPLLQAANIPVIPGHVAATPNKAVEIASRLGYPVALKIVSPGILHKSEAGGIMLNVTGPDAVSEGYRQLLQNARDAHPAAQIDGVLVEAMAPPGHDVIIGMRRDPQFGPLLMFGLGGIYVELLTDVSFRVAPLSRSQARTMITETRAGKLLAGVRGQPPADIEAVVDCLLRLGRLALDCPQIAEIEVNPLRVLPRGRGAVALDGRVILKEVSS